MPADNLSFEEIAYVISHDFKEPLRLIKNALLELEQGENKNLSPKGNEKLEEVQGSVEFMTNMVSDLMDYNKIGQKEKAFMEINLSSVLQKSLKLLEEEIQSSKVKISYPPALPWLPCDKTLVRNLFTYLISNALKYNNRSNKKLEIGVIDHRSTSTQPPEGSRGDIFFIRDNGIGIRKKHFANIFKVFRRLHPQSKYGGGMGMGLAFAKRIVEHHGGEIWLESEHGKGTTFYFTLS